MARRIHIAKRVNPSDWISSPEPIFVEGIPSSYDLTQHLFSAGIGKSIGVSSGALPDGVELVDEPFVKALEYDGVGAPAVATGIVLSSVPYIPPPEASSDWNSRINLPGVFYANNFTDLHTGTPGSRVSDIDWFVGDVGLPRMVTQEINREDVGDGFGVNWRDTSPAIGGQLAGGACYGLRRVRRWSDALGDESGNLYLRIFGLVTPNSNDPPTGCDRWFVPFDYTKDESYTGPGAWSVGYDAVDGEPGMRYGIPGTAGEGLHLPYVETRVTDGVTTSTNPNNLPQPRHTYFQYQVFVEEPTLWGREWMWRVEGETVPSLSPNAASDSRTTNANYKSNFYNGGVSGDQVAGILSSWGFLNLLLYDGSASYSITTRRKHLESTTYGDSDGTPFACGIDVVGGTDLPTTARGEEMITRYGLNGAICLGLAGMPDLRNPLLSRQPGLNAPNQWLTREIIEANPSIIPPADREKANFLSAPWRNYPYGGFDPVRGVFPDLAGLTPAAKFNVIIPGRWHVIEMLVSDQADVTVNNAVTQPASTLPRVTAVWAAPRGEPPRLVGSSTTNGRLGAAMVGSRCLRRPNLKLQNAEQALRGYTGWSIVDSTDNPGCMDPTATQFDCVNYRQADAPPGSIASDRTRFWPANSDLNGDPSGYSDWGGGAALAFTYGALAAAIYAPRPELSVDRMRSHNQFDILRTERRGITLVNPYGETREVQRITLEQPMPIAPVRGNAFVVNMQSHRYSVYTTKSLPNQPDSRLYYGELVAGVDPIPFPFQLDVPLPMPWPAPGG